MGHQGIAGQGGAHPELADPAAEGGGRSRRERADPDGQRVGRHPLAYRLIVILEEIVEDAPRGLPPSPDIDQTDEFRRTYPYLPRLLRDERPAAEHGGIIYLVVEIFPAELDVRRRLQLLAPEAVEIRESGILEAGDVHPLIELESGRDRLPHHQRALAEGKPEEQVLRRDAPRSRSSAARRRGGRRGRAASRRRTVRNDFKLRHIRAVFLAFDSNLRGLQPEMPRPLGHKDIGIGGLGSLRARAVDYRHRGRAPLLRPPHYLEIIPRAPFEVRRGVLSRNHERHVELLVDPDKIRGLHLHRRLGRGNQRQRRRDDYGKQFSAHHQFFSFCLDFSSAAFSLLTLSRVSFSLACTAFSICRACCGDISCRPSSCG